MAGPFKLMTLGRMDYAFNLATMGRAFWLGGKIPCLLKATSIKYTLLVARAIVRKESELLDLHGG